MIPEVGTRIADKYTLLEKISEGGGGVVWRTEGDIALKILKILPFQSKELLADRFKREFELFKKVSHPNIAKIYDFGFDGNLDLYFFTSELLLGGDLKKKIGASIQEVEHLLLSALRALEYLRNFGILHLDIKPQNLLLRSTSELALIDFGLAGFNPPERPGGTPNYMSPEAAARRLQIDSSSIDHRSDLYSLGATFYYILSGVHPFAVLNQEGHLDSEATMRRHLSNDRPEPPSSRNPDVPPYLDAVIMRLMAKNPDERYQTAMLAAQALCFRSPNNLSLETKETIGAYLPEEGALIGRQKEKGILENLISNAAKGTSQKLPIAFILGDGGTGKTRLLTSLKPFAQQQEMDVVTDLREEKIYFNRPTAFLIDDPPDAYSLERITRYILQMPKARLCLIVALNPENAKQIFYDPSACTVVNLKNFTIGEVGEYLEHLLGEEPSKKIVQELYEASFGNPRFISDFFKRMLRRGEIFSYFAGRPGAQTLDDMGFSFSHVASPPSLAEHIISLVKELPADARLLAERLACWQRPVTIEELGGDDVSALLSSGLVKRDDRGIFSFANPVASRVVEKNIEAGKRSAIHDSIVEYLFSLARPEQGRRTLEINRHLVFGSDLKLRGEAAARLALEALKNLHPAEVAELLQDVFEALPEAESKARAEVLVRQGHALARMGRVDDAKAVFERMSLIDPIRAEEQKGWLKLRQRNLSEARKIFENALKKVDAGRNAVAAIRLQNYLAGTDLREGKYSQAADTYARTVKLAAKLSEEEQLQITNNELGEATLLMGKMKEAVKILGREIEWASRADHFERIASSLLLLGDVHRRLGDLQKSLEYYTKALNFSRGKSLFENQLRIHNSLANLLRQMGKFNEAIEHYKPALDLALQLEGKATPVDIMTNIGMAYNKLGRYDDAIEYLELALDFAKGPEAESSVLIRKIIPDIHITLGHAHYEKKDFDEAKKHLNAALQDEGTASLSPLILYNLHGTLAEVDLACGEIAKAKERIPILEKLAAQVPEAAKHLKEIKKQIEK